MTQQGPFDPPPSAKMPSAAPAEPPLSILHLLVFTGCVAVALAIHRERIRNEASLSEVERAVGIVMNLLWAIVAGAGLSGIILAISRPLRGYSALRQPGHWLMTIRGAYTIAIMLVTLVELAFPAKFGEHVQGNVMMLTWALLSALFGGMLMTAPLIVHRASPRWTVWWRLYFWVEAFGQFQSAMYLGAFSFQPNFLSMTWLAKVYPVCSIVEAGVAIVLMLGAVIADHVGNVRRGWWHGAGAAFACLGLLIQATWTGYYLIRAMLIN